MSELESIIANLGYPVGMGMAPSSADLTRMKSAIIEECALLVAERAIWTSDRDLKDGLIVVAAAIRALKDKKP